MEHCVFVELCQMKEFQQRVSTPMHWMHKAQYTEVVACMARCTDRDSQHKVGKGVIVFGVDITSVIKRAAWP